MRRGVGTDPQLRRFRIVEKEVVAPVQAVADLQRSRGGDAEAGRFPPLVLRLLPEARGVQAGRVRCLVVGAEHERGARVKFVLHVLPEPGSMFHDAVAGRLAPGFRVQFAEFPIAVIPAGLEEFVHVGQNIDPRRIREGQIAVADDRFERSAVFARLLRDRVGALRGISGRQPVAVAGRVDPAHEVHAVLLPARRGGILPGAFAAGAHDFHAFVEQPVRIGFRGAGVQKLRIFRIRHLGSADPVRIGDGIIDNYDMVKVGNTVPKWTGGINTSVTWKDLTLSARFDYALGFKAVDWKTMWIMSCAQGTYNTIAETHDTWSPENPGAQYPTYVWADQLGKRNYCRQSSMFAYNGNYLSFREIALSYNLPSNWVRKAGLGSVMLSVTGQNLGYLTEAKHLFSPEKTDNNGGYPLPRTVILGVNVSF